MANYDTFTSKIERNEGGYQKLIKDRGNYNSKGELVGTNYGISAKVYENVIKRPPSEFDMRKITQIEAHNIFKTLFWDRMQGDKINSQKIADLLIDHGINASPIIATKIIQRVLNQCFNYSLKVDGNLGENTLNAINSVNEINLFKALAFARIEAYNGLNDCVHFCNVWHNRVYYIASLYGIKVGDPLECQKKK